MTNCDMCGKVALLPETIGSVHFCKICFLKLHGSAWKDKTYTLYTDMVNEYNKTIAIAQQNYCLQSGLTGIYDYFMAKASNMKPCDVCGIISSTFKKIEKNHICNNCFSNIEKVYDANGNSPDEIEKNKRKAVQKATQLKYPVSVINSIEKHFDSQIKKDGWLYTIPGGLGQTLEVYDTYCKIITSSKFNNEKIGALYDNVHHPRSSTKKQTNISDTPGILTAAKGAFSAGDAVQLLSTAASKGIVRAGVLATTKIVSSAVQSPTKVAQKNPETMSAHTDFSIRPGEQVVLYNHCATVQFQNAIGRSLGYIRFYPSNMASNDCDLIFFYSPKTSANIKNSMPDVYNTILNHISNPHKSSNQVAASQGALNNSQIAKDILSYKNLLDLGAITQKEFDAKKKELLGL